MGQKLAFLLCLLAAPAYGQSPIHLLMSGSEARAAAASGFVVGHAVQVASNTSTGNQAITITWSDAGSYTPDCAFITSTNAVDDATAVTHAAWSIGAASSASAEWAVSGWSQNAQDPSNHESYATDVGVVALYSAGATLDALADLSSFSSNTVTINWSNAPGSAYDLFVLAFAGSDACEAGTVSPCDTDACTTDVTSLGDQADFIIGSQTQRYNIWNESNTAHNAAALWLYDATRNRSVMKTHRDALSGEDTRTRWHSTRIGCDVAHNLGDCTGEWSVSTNANGFTVTTNGTPTRTENQLGYLAVALPAGTSSYTGTFVTPTSTGNSATTDPGFTPQAVLVAGSLIDAASGGIESVSPDADGFFVGHAISTTDEGGWSIDVEDNVNPTDTQARSDNEVATLTTGGGTIDIQADVNSFDANGFTLNFTTTDATARNWIYLAFE